MLLSKKPPMQKQAAGGLILTIKLNVATMNSAMTFTTKCYYIDGVIGAALDDSVGV